MKSGLIGMTVV